MNDRAPDADPEPEPDAVEARPGELRALVPSAEPDDAALVARALEGDAWAEEALYRRHAPRALDTAARLLGRLADAEDVLQDSFVAALRRLDELREPAHFERWLLRIIVNRARNVLRRRALRRTLGLDRGADDATLARLASPDASPEARAQLAELDAVVRSLATDERVAWVLRVVEQRTMPEIAAAMACSVATAKRRVASAEAIIRRRLR